MHLWRMLAGYCTIKTLSISIFLTGRLVPYLLSLWEGGKVCCCIGLKCGSAYVFASLVPIQDCKCECELALHVAGKMSDEVG